jgi:hypothetical protein
MVVVGLCMCKRETSSVSNFKSSFFESEASFASLKKIGPALANMILYKKKFRPALAYYNMINNK